MKTKILHFAADFICVACVVFALETLFNAPLVTTFALLALAVFFYNIQKKPTGVRAPVSGRDRVVNPLRENKLIYTIHECKEKRK